MSEEKQLETLEDYKKAYEEEQYQNMLLSTRLSEAQALADEKERQIQKIKTSLPWRMSKPLRVTMHWAIRQKNRLHNLGGPRGIARKMKSKSIEIKARAQHGTASFPDAEEAKRQREEKFPEEHTFSILVPLYNTPENFLRDMIGSVQAQTYEKWELCLADGSDDAHAFVGQICKEYADKDKRIKYHKLAENGGISKNTNECLKLATGDYIALFDHDDILHPAALYEYMKVICAEGADRC